MKRTVIALALATLLALAATASTAAHGPCDDVNGDGSPSGQEYGQSHVSSHTPHGIGVEGHNPGTHQGFSLCLGVH
jgi:hypothetical protein